MKIGVIGANGQLGVDICKAFANVAGNEVISLTHKDIALENIDSISYTLPMIGADIIINTAAYHNLDECEKNVYKSFLLNTEAVRDLAILSNQLKFKLVHISTDYVFDGIIKTPYMEGDIPNPLNVYGVTKLAGEYFIQNIAKDYLIIRTSSLFGKNPCRAKGGLNFVQLMLKLADENKPIQVVADQFSAPTCTSDLAIQIRTMVQQNAFGLYHVVSDGGCSWYEFAKEIFRISGKTPNLSPKATLYDEKATRRPMYSVLSNSKLSRDGFGIMPTWNDALRSYLAGA